MMAAPPFGEAPQYGFEWRQDARIRVLKLAGNIDETAASHLANGLIDLGNRRLVIDLSAVEEMAQAAVGELLEMVERLGGGRVTIDLGENEPLALQVDLTGLEVHR